MKSERKTREALTETVLPDWEQNVLCRGSPIHFGPSGTIPQHRTRQSFQFPNGSIVVLGGMDKLNQLTGKMAPDLGKHLDLGMSTFSVGELQSFQ